MNIVLIGSGNVAQHLGKAFRRAGHAILQVCSPTLANAELLATQLGAESIPRAGDVRIDADLYLLAVRDQDLSTVVAELPANLQGIVVHTSGATNMDILQKWTYYGVIYPPQSLSKTIDTDISAIPFALEGRDQGTYNALIELMLPIAPKTFAANSEQRLALHIAAVFANNFSNALFTVAFDLLRQQNLSPELIRPIIMETARKVQEHAPEMVQTGPAVRNDQQTISRHLNYLKSESDWQEIYQIMSDFIGKKQF